MREDQLGSALLDKWNLSLFDHTNTILFTVFFVLGYFFLEISSATYIYVHVKIIAAPNRNLLHIFVSFLYAKMGRLTVDIYMCFHLIKGLTFREWVCVAAVEAEQ